MVWFGINNNTQNNKNNITKITVEDKKGEVSEKKEVVEKKDIQENKKEVDQQQNKEKEDKKEEKIVKKEEQPKQKEVPTREKVEKKQNVVVQKKEVKPNVRACEYARVHTIRYKGETHKRLDGRPFWTAITTNLKGAVAENLVIEFDLNEMIYKLDKGELTFRAWKNSQGHYETMVNNQFKFVGIAYCYHDNLDLNYPNSNDLYSKGYVGVQLFSDYQP